MCIVRASRITFAAVSAVVIADAYFKGFHTCVLKAEYKLEE